MTRISLLVASAILGLGAAQASAAQVVNIDGTSSVGTTVQLAAGTYDVTYAGIAGGGLYDGYSLRVNGSTPVSFTDELSISLGASTNFNTAATYDYIVGGKQVAYSTAAAALLGYDNALATGTLSESASYTPQNYVYSNVSKIEFTLASAGPVTFTAPDKYQFAPPPAYGDDTGGVSILVTAVPEPASLAVLAAGVFALGFVRRTTRRASHA